MSAPSAGKFQDHYDVLGIDPKSNSEMVQRAYTVLAQKYHPKNPDTGDEEKFKAVNLAYEVLSDPMLRRAFDGMRASGSEEEAIKFSGLAFFDSLGRETGRRLAILCVLLDRRQLKPFTPSLSMRNLENLVVGTPEELNLAIWYLKQKGLMMSDDKSAFLITIDGIDHLENNRPTPQVILPFIKAAKDVPASASTAKGQGSATDISRLGSALRQPAVA